MLLHFSFVHFLDFIPNFFSHFISFNYGRIFHSSLSSINFNKLFFYSKFYRKLFYCESFFYEEFLSIYIFLFTAEYYIMMRDSDRTKEKTINRQKSHKKDSGA